MASTPAGMMVWVVEVEITVPSSAVRQLARMKAIMSQSLFMRPFIEKVLKQTLSSVFDRGRLLTTDVSWEAINSLETFLLAFFFPFLPFLPFLALV